MSAMAQAKPKVRIVSVPEALRLSPHKHHLYCLPWTRDDGIEPKYPPLEPDGPIAIETYPFPVAADLRERINTLL